MTTIIRHTAPNVANKRRLHEEIASAVGRQVTTRIEWGDDELTIQLRESLTDTEVTAVRAAIASHDGTVRNAADAEAEAAAKQAKLGAIAAKRSLLSKLETGTASPAEIQQALALALR